MPDKRGLIERLKDGESVLCAEGYLREVERRGYLTLGANTPEAVLRHPERVRAVHEEFALAGSDVIEAFTYYGHRSKLATVGYADKTEKLNRTALRMARDVAKQHNKLMAGNISNSMLYDPGNPDTHRQVRDMFEEQVTWATEEGADYIIGETFHDFGEAKIALESIQKCGQGLPAVITLAIYGPERTTDDVPFTEALRQLEVAGAAVVGLNCGRGPATMMPLIRKARGVVKGPLAALPVMFRTTETEPTFYTMTDPLTGQRLSHTDRESRACCRSDVRQFAREAREAGVNYIGLCCGANASLFREVAEEYGRRPPASAYAPEKEQTALYNPNPTDYIIKKRMFQTRADV